MQPPQLQSQGRGWGDALYRKGPAAMETSAEALPLPRSIAGSSPALGEGARPNSALETLPSHYGLSDSEQIA